MIRNILLSFCIACATMAFSQPTVIPAGNVSGTWTKAGSPYQINGNITIPDSAKLILQPGTIVLFMGQYSLTVSGSLQALGNKTDSVFFKAQNTVNGWNAIHISSIAANNDSSVFRYTRFEYSKTIWFIFGAALNITNSNKVVIDNCVFYKNETMAGGAIYASDCNFNINNTLFYSNNTAGVRTSNSSITYSNCRFFNNQSAGLIQFSDSRFANCLFCNNGTGGLTINDSRPLIMNCVFYNNTNYGIVLERSVLNLVNSVVWNHSLKGIQVRDFSSETNIQNCVYQNGKAGVEVPVSGNYVGEYQNNIVTNPLFVSPTAGIGTGYNALLANWYLQYKSPCINTGSNAYLDYSFPSADIFDKKRISHGIIDIGAAEFYNKLASLNTNITKDTIIIADSIYVTNNITIANQKKVTILPSTKVVFTDHFTLTNLGTMIVNGTKNSPVHFTVKDTTGNNNRYGNKGGWAGIIFRDPENDNDTNIFRYCVFEFAKDPESDGVFNMYDYSKTIIENSSFHSNSSLNSPILVSVNSLFFLNTDTFCNNRSNYCILMNSQYKSSRICNSLFEQNYAYYGTGLLELNETNPYLLYNTFRYNRAGDSALGNSSPIYLRKANANITGNKIYCNYGSKAGAIYSELSYPKMINNLIYNNSGYDAGAVIISGATALLLNNTIVNNHGYFAGGIRCDYLGKINSYNDLLWGNIKQTYINNLLLNSSSGLINLYNTCTNNNDSSIQYKGGAISENLTRSSVLSSNPAFINSTDSAGILKFPFNADWSLADTSAIINKGSVQDIAPAEIPAVDVNGNQRIWITNIDIGAIENMGTTPTISRQPLNIFKCQGDTITFKASTESTCLFQWQKNGVNIPNACDSILVIKNITDKDEANYNCKISNSHGTVFTNNALLSVKSEPKIISSLADKWIIPGNDYQLNGYATGSDPLKYTWLKDKDTLLNEVSPVLSFKKFSHTNDGTYRIHISNFCGSYTDSAKLKTTPRICLVTVDTASNYNLIAWDPVTTYPVTKYIIYREIEYNLFDSIGEVNTGDITVFSDKDVKPNVFAYRYKLTVISEGKESDIQLSEPHRTINLTTISNSLIWNAYEGFNFPVYEIYRSLDGHSFSLAASVPSGPYFNSWNDPVYQNTPGVIYLVSVNSPVVCDPAGLLKADTGPYAQSMSNLVEFKSSGLKSVSDLHSAVFPNPFCNSFTIHYLLTEQSTVSIDIINELGVEVYQITQIQQPVGIHDIKLNAADCNLSEGMHIIKIVANNQVSILRCTFQR